MTTCLIIADDLTGALDSAAAFAGRTPEVVVATSPNAIAQALTRGAEVVAVSTNTRDASAGHAADAIRSVLREAEDRFEVIFKKIDSRLKGHISTELATLREFRNGGFLANPAVPALGRYCVDGAVTGAGVDVDIPVEPALGTDATIPNARSDVDLDRAVAKAPTDTIFVGAAGLSAALARALFRTDKRRASSLRLPLLCAVGSRDPVTLKQIEQVHGVPVSKAPDGKVKDVPVAPVALVQIVPGRSVAESAAAADFANGVAHHIRLHKPASLFACGGETAATIMIDLGIGCLRVEGELLPGVPVSIALDGVPGLAIITKSGGFGGADMLRDIISLIAAPSAGKAD